MPRPRRAARSRRTISDALRRWAYGLEAIEGEKLFKYTTTAEHFAGVWDALRDEVVADWIAEHPGTRPARWWGYDAPDDPPVFESEAAYLDRLGLLTEGERDYLDEHGWPEPERVEL